MNVTIVSASPKTGKSNSDYFAGELIKLLGGAAVSQLRLKNSMVTLEQTQQAALSDALVLCFPLYVDAIPSHLLRILMEWETVFSQAAQPKPTVYAMVNCGFYEGEQNHLALDILRHWCRRAGLNWGMGIGIGAGEMMGNLENVPIGHGPKKTLGMLIGQLAQAILERREDNEAYVRPNFPRPMFKMMASIGWVQQAKRNGVRKKDLYVLP